MKIPSLSLAKSDARRFQVVLWLRLPTCVVSRSSRPVTDGEGEMQPNADSGRIREANSTAWDSSVMWRVVLFSVGLPAYR